MSLPLIETLDKAYHVVVDILPSSINQHEEACAAGLGFAGGYFATYLLQKISKGIDKYIIPGFDKVLPYLETGCIALTVAAAVSLGIERETLETAIQQHPVYVSGVNWTLLASVLRAGQDLNKRAKEKTLEEKLIKDTN